MSKIALICGVASLHRVRTVGLGVVSVALLVACGDSAGNGGPSAPQAGAAGRGGAPGSGGAPSGLGGSGVSGSGGSSVPGSGGSAGTPQAGAIGSGGTPSSAGTPGQSTGGTPGGSTGGGAGASGQATTGGAPAGGAASAGAAGKGGQASGGTMQAGAGGKASASQGGVGGSQGGAMQAGAGGKAGASQGGAGGKGGGGGAGASGCKGGKVVHFVYFVESDQTYNEGHRNDVEKQAFNFQSYWYQQLGVTFYLSEPVVDVIRADHPAAWYVNTPDGIHGDQRWYRLGNIKNEVYRKLGIQNFDPNHRVVNYPTTRHDGRVGANFGGAWMDGDDLTCIATNGVNYPYPPPQDSPAHCLGHVAHEFGHILGLDHEGPQDGCMQFGFYQPLGGPMCNIGSANVAKIKAAASNAGWFNATPGQTCAP